MKAKAAFYGVFHQEHGGSEFSLLQLQNAKHVFRCSHILYEDAKFRTQNLIVRIMFLSVHSHRVRERNFAPSTL